MYRVGDTVPLTEFAAALCSATGSFRMTGAFAMAHPRYRLSGPSYIATFAKMGFQMGSSIPLFHGTALAKPQGPALPPDMLGTADRSYELTCRGGHSGTESRPFLAY
jgi:hypothetical protein